MRVLYLRSNPVDPDSRVEKEVEALIENGIKVDIFCWDRKDNHPIIKEKKHIHKVVCPIYRVGVKSVYGAGFRNNLIPLIGFQKSIKRFMEKYHQQYDVIHACDFDTAYISFKMAQKYHIRLIYDIFDYYVDAFNVPGFLKKIVMKSDTKIINNADGVIICSEQRREQLRDSRPRKLVIIHNAPQTIQTQDNIHILNNKSNRLKIAYIGILNDGRMIPEMLTVVSENNNLELHIGGFGKYESLVEDYAKNNDNIIYYGKIPYEETLKIEKDSDVLTAIYDPSIPNHKYAAPNKFYEALMLGKPLIMCRNTGMSEVVDTNKFGVLIDYSAESLQQGLASILDNIGSYKKNSQKEQEFFNEKYSWNIMTNRLLSFYSEVGKGL